MAPEQIRGKPRPASDQYALGVVVYEWLTGDRPFHGSFTEIATQHIFEPPPPLREKNPTLGPALEQAVMRALAKEPELRWACVQAFATALEQACLPVQHPPPGSPSQLLEPTVVAIPPTHHVWPPIPAASWSRPPEPAGISTPSFQGERTKPAISRRTVLAGLGALTVVGLGGSLTWLARSHRSQQTASQGQATPNTGGASSPTLPTRQPTTGNSSHASKTVVVQAAQDWQNTGARIHRGNRVTIEYVSGPFHLHLELPENGRIVACHWSSPSPNFPSKRFSDKILRRTLAFSLLCTTNDVSIEMGGT
jgi:serine/threonine protein kinase